MPRTNLKLNLLYPLLLSGVLLVNGCAENSRGTSDNESVPESEEAEQFGVNESEEPDVGQSESVLSKATREDGSPYRILFLGDSITAGYGIEPENAYPALIQTLIDEIELPFTVSDGGLSGDTSAGGLSRLSWLLREPVDILVVELGGNDGLRGIKTDVTRKNLARIIELTRSTYPDVTIILAGMQVPPNLGHEYTEAFREIYPDLSNEYDTELIPFILEGVGGHRELNQPDQIHPTAEGHKIVAHNVWLVLEPVLMEYRTSGAEL